MHLENVTGWVSLTDADSERVLKSGEKDIIFPQESGPNQNLILLDYTSGRPHSQVAIVARIAQRQTSFEELTLPDRDQPLHSMCGHISEFKRQ